MSIDPGIAAAIAAHWSGKTLAMLRDEAMAEANGTAFDAVKIPGKGRVALVVCVTAPDQLSLVGRFFDLVDDGAREDWNTLTLGEVFSRTWSAAVLRCELFGGGNGSFEAVVLIAADPRSMEMLGRFFSFPV